MAISEEILTVMLIHEREKSMINHGFDNQVKITGNNRVKDTRNIISPAEK